MSGRPSRRGAVGCLPGAHDVHALLKGLSVDNKALGAAGLGKLTKALSYLGPVGDLASYVTNMLDAAACFEKGMMVKGWCLTVSGAASLVSLGTFVVFGLSNPVGWVCAAVGALAALASALFGESEEEVLVREVDEIFDVTRGGRSKPDSEAHDPANARHVYVSAFNWHEVQARPMAAKTGFDLCARVDNTHPTRTLFGTRTDQKGRKRTTHVTARWLDRWTLKPLSGYEPVTVPLSVNLKPGGSEWQLQIPMRAPAREGAYALELSVEEHQGSKRMKFPKQGQSTCAFRVGPARG